MERESRSPAAALASSSLELARASDDAAILEAGARAARLASGADRAIVQLHVRASGELGRWTATSGFAAEELPGAELAPGPLALQALSSNQRMAAKVTERRGIATFPGGAPFSAVLVLPVASPRGVYGWLAVMNVAGSSLDEDAEIAAGAIAAQIALAHERLASATAAATAGAVAQTLIDQLPATTYYRALDAPGVPSFVSPQAEAMLGYPREEWTKDPDFWRKHIHPDDRERVLAEQARIGPDTWGRPVAAKYRMVHKDGSTVWVKNFALAVPDSEGRPRLMMGVIFDETELERAALARKKSEARLETLIGANIIAVASGDLQGNIAEANDAFLAIVGRSRAELSTGRISAIDLTPAEWRALDERATQALRARGVAEPYEKQYRRPDGTRVPVLVGAALIPESGTECIWYALDLSERKRLEAQLEQAMRMEALGRLAGGVAHDFNNLLSVILGYSSMLIESLPEGSRERRDVEEIVEAGDRARELTAQLLAVSRQQMLVPKVIDVATTLRGIEGLLRRMITEDVELVIELPTEPLRIRADPGQIHQVILNLGLNARDAMPRSGRLTISVDAVTLDEQFARSHLGVKPGAYVQIMVADTGTGMDAATRARIFEPFFTTKPRGRGTGLGLSTVFGVVQQSGGTIWVDSEPGQGTVFKIYFPRTEAPLSPSSEPSRETIAGGTETVLLVEDEEQVRVLVRGILERYGYHVIQASSGSEALDAAKSYPGPIDLLVSDVVMPGMSGPELAEQLLAVRPSTKVLFMSGYADDALARHGVIQSDATLLAKPFTGVELVKAIREALGEGPARTSRSSR